MEVILHAVRHGESASNVEHRLSGWHDVPLTAKGRAQAQAVKPHVTGDYTSVWSSDLRRAQETASLAWGSCPTDRRLREMDFGSYEGRCWKELSEEETRKILAFESFTPPGGEPFAQVRARVLAFIEQLGAGCHLLFTHGGVLRTLLAELGQPRFVPNASVVGINWTRSELLFVHTPPSETPAIKEA